MAWTTTLIRTSHPTKDKSFSSQPWSLRQTHSLMYLKLAFFVLPIKDGKPKYFSYYVISKTPKVFLMIFIIYAHVNSKYHQLNL